MDNHRVNMRRFLFAAVLATVAAPLLAGDVGVSLSIGQPGFYGRVDIGGYPPPRVVYPQPVFVERVPVSRAPVYLHVPPGHAKHWRKNCHRYGACGERVYFVQNNWYRHEYVPRHYHYQAQPYPRYRTPDGHRDYRRDGYRNEHRHYRRSGRHDG